MSEMWARLGHPDVETMLAEIAANDMLSAALARAVWESVPVPEQARWREQLAAAILSYRGPWQNSRIGQIATARLVRLNEG